MTEHSILRCWESQLLPLTFVFCQCIECEMSVCVCDLEKNACIHCNNVFLSFFEYENSEVKMYSKCSKD